MAAPRRPPGRIGDVPHQVLRLDLRTMSLRAVAKKYGVAINSARYWRDKLGLTSPRPPPARGPDLQPHILAYLTAHPEGATRATLATALSDTPTMLYRCLIRLETHGQVTRTLERMGARWESQSRWFVVLPDQETP